MKCFFSNNKGGVLVLAAAIFPLLIIVMALVVDIGRTYAIQSKAQSASDAALLGAVATMSTHDLTEETTRIFNADFPASYMGAIVGAITTAEVSPSVYEASFTIQVPTLLTGVFNSNMTTVNILSQVTRGYEIEQNRRLELALVLDNTGSMSGQPIEGLKNASRDLTNILFGSAETLNNVHVSLLPYDVDVNIGPDRASWIQGAYLAPYNVWVPSGNGFVSNRNSDSPRNLLDDFTDAAPTTEETRFRVPVNAPNTSCGDVVTPSLPRMHFGMNSKSQILAVIDTMIASGCTRINVGLMWGWFTLSPSWQGLWDANQPTLPSSPNPLLDKAVVLMTDGQNTVFNGAAGTSNDNDTTALLCTAIKAQGITLYTVGFSGNVNETLLRNCATSPSHYWFAPNEAELRTAFRQIADDLVFSTIRLSK